MRYLDKKYLLTIPVSDNVSLLTDVWANIAYETVECIKSALECPQHVSDCFREAMRLADVFPIKRGSVFQYKPNADRVTAVDIEPITINGTVYAFNRRYTKWVKKGEIKSLIRDSSAIIVCNGYYVASIRTDHKVMEMING